MPVETGNPGNAIYKCRLKDQSGILVAEFDDWRSLAWTKEINKRGTMRFEIDANDSRSELFDLDGQFEIWRANPMIDLDWYLEWEGFVRSSNDLYYPNNKTSYVAYGFSYLDLAKRAHIMWPAGSSQATKSAAAETALKELVNENIGASALAASGRAADNVMPGLQTEADGANGPTWENSVEYDNLLTTIQDITFFTQDEEDPIYFDIIGTGVATFEFRTYQGQRGSDRTQGNSDGNAPVTFALNFGNMIAPTLSTNRSEERTAVYGIGSGTADAKQIETVLGANYNASPWNRIEDTVTGSVSGEDISTQLQTKAKERLNERTVKTEISFTVIQIASSYYGKDYFLGDKVSVNYKEWSFNKHIARITATVSQNAGGEDFKIEVGDGAVR